MSKLRILIAANEPFPIGMAATNRIVSLARGFQEEGIPLLVVLMRSMERPEVGIVNPDPSGSYLGINYAYAAGTTVRPDSFLKRRIQVARGMLRTIGIARAFTRPGEDSALILYSNGLIFMLFFFFLCRSLGIKYTIDKSEFPFVLRRTSLVGRIYAYLFTTFCYKMFDVMFVMTTPLERYFHNRIRKNARLFHVPMTVEMSRFMENPPTMRSGDPYIAYCGYLVGNKDGVSILIEAFALILKKHQDLKLYIIGDSPGTDDLERLKRLAADLHVENNVVFTGRVHRDEIPRFLCNATILALARPSSLQSEGGFPTKLGEYLSTGNPVVVTAVGDIPLYLQDGKNGFLAKPDSAEAFAEKLDFVLEHPDLAREVGSQGRRLALDNFDYRVQAQRVVNFLVGGQS